MSGENQDQQHGLLHSLGSSDFDSLLGSQPSAPATGTPVTAPAASPSTPKVEGAPPLEATKLSKSAGPDGAAERTDGGAAAPAGQQSAAQPTPPSATPGIDPAVLESIVSAAAKGSAAGLQQAQSSAAAQAKADIGLTPEQFNAKYGIRQATPDDLATILGQDPKKAVDTLNSLLIAATRSGVLMAKDLFEAQTSELRATYDPHISAWQQHQAELREKTAETSFYKTYPELEAERATVTEMKDAILLRVKSGQLKFANEQQAFKAVADATKAVLARYGRTAAAPSGAPSSNGQLAQHQGQTPPQRQMAAASTAGTQGSGKTAGSSTDELAGVFGEAWR